MIRPSKAEIEEVVRGPVRKFSVPRPRLVRTRERRWHHSIIYSDTHFPFQDDDALNVVLSVIKDVDPENIIHGGDLLDCHKMSPKFTTDPMHNVSLQQEIDLARAHLHQVSTVAPEARKVLLEGNHEDRLRRAIWDLKGAAQEMAKLDVFQANITWPVLLGLEEIGWEFVPLHGQAHVRILPKMITKHGNVVKAWSGASAKAEYDSYNKSGTSGHTHRLGKYYHRGLDGSQVWVETGCTCKINPEYTEDPDWQQGLVIVTHTDNGERYHVEDVYIENGTAVWRDNLYAK